MNIKRTKYIIINEDENFYLLALCDFNGGENYTDATFTIDFNAAKQFTSKKLAQIDILNINKCNYFELKYKRKFKFKKIDLPKVKIVKLSIKMEDVK
jgi:methyl coenzyme M reductase subunit C